jgi:hypothetical protein
MAKDRVNAYALGTAWNRCEVAPVMSRGVIQWKLSSRPYSFLGAYKKFPHRQLIKAGTDEDLLSFVKSWGPLHNDTAQWEGEHAIGDYRHQRDFLRAWARLLSPSTQRWEEDIRSGICALLRLDNSGTFVFQARWRLGYSDPTYQPFDDELERRIASATQRKIEELYRVILGGFESTGRRQIQVEGLGKEKRLRAGYRFNSLRDALYWMMWEDIFRERPFCFCAVQGCGELIIRADARNQKFCKFCSENGLSKRAANQNSSKVHRERLRARGLTSRGKEPKRNDGARPKKGHAL